MPKNDIIRNLGIAGAAALPVVGGTLSFLLDKYVPSENIRRQNAFLQKLSEDIEVLKEKVNPQNMDTPEFKAIFMKLLSESVLEHREEKLVAFRNIILNMLIDKNSQQFNKVEFFSKLVTDLTPDEIKILNVFYQMDVKKIRITNDSGKKRQIYKILMDIFHEENKDYIRALLNDCMKYELISGSPNQERKYGRKGIFITDLGQELVEYIFTPEEANFNDKRQ